MWEKVLAILLENWGKTLGLIIGAGVGLLILTLGFLKSLFVVFCALCGYFIGKMVDTNQDLRIWINRIFKDQ